MEIKRVALGNLREKENQMKEIWGISCGIV